MKLEPERGFGDGWYVSHYNESDSNSLASGRRPIIHDTTLRDGEQQAGVVFSKEEKVAIARLLAQCGVDRIETSIPVVSEDDQIATAKIASLDLPAETWVAVRAITKDVELAASLGVDGAGIICMANDQYLNIFGWTLDGVLDQVTDAVERAKALGLAATVLIVDSSRMSRERLATIVEILESRTGGDGFAFMDTYGVLSPQGAQTLVTPGAREVRIDRAPPRDQRTRVRSDA